MKRRNEPAADDDLDFPAHLLHFRPTEWVVGETWVDGALAWMRARAEWRRAHPAYSLRYRERWQGDYFDSIRRESE